MSKISLFIKALVVAVLFTAPFACEQQQVLENPVANQSSVQAGKLLQLPALDSLGNAVGVASPQGKIAANVPYVSGFSFPFGNDQTYSQASDKDGWFNAQGLDFGRVVAKQYHTGEDWNIETGGANADQGQPCYAMAEGEIVYSSDAGSCWGGVVIIRHKLPNGSEIETQYGHLSKRTVSVGKVVQRREQIGNIGGQGLNCNGPMSAHLHLEARNSNCASWGKPGPGYSTSTTGWFAASSLVYSNFPTWPLALGTPANNASIRRSTNQLFSWQNFWLLNAESRIQIAYSTNSTPGWNAQSGFTQGIIYNQNIGRFNGLSMNFSVPGNYYWTVRSSNQGYSSGFGLYTSIYTQPRKFTVLSY
jgi:murein DD-endopeptidase MepM/ murein hydrolase activator NlpD